MNGPHDVGGRHGFGAIEIEVDEPLFHHPWEGRVFGIALGATGASGWTLDFSRHSRELMPHGLYLSSSCYQKWLLGREAVNLAAGLITLEELKAGHAQDRSEPPRPAAAPDTVLPGLAGGYNAEREIDEAPRYSAGDAVITKNLHPSGHTRLPGYARDKRGSIAAHRGAFVFPDTNAHGKGEAPGHLYTVAFAARTLWGETAAAQDKVYLDLWEAYLDPA